jgi:cation transport ATPase
MMAGAILLGLPIVVHAVKSIIHGETHMDELVALAIVAAFATQQYATAGIVAFFMLCSELVETRTALGARASIESLIKLTPTKAQLLVRMVRSRKWMSARCVPAMSFALSGRYRRRRRCGGKRP